MGAGVERTLEAKAVAAKRWAPPVARPVKEPSAAPPMAVVENSSRCPTNADGEKCVTLENDQKVPWLPALVGAMVDASTQSVKKKEGDGKSYYLFDYKKIKKSGANPNTRHKLWMLPAVLVQWFVLRPIIVKVIRNDIRKDRAIDRYVL